MRPIELAELAERREDDPQSFEVRVDHRRRYQRNLFFFVLGSVVGTIFWFASINSDNSPAVRVGGVISTMVIWWLTECLPLSVTSLLPAFMFPLLGIMSASKVCSLYFNDTLFLFISSSLLGVGMERWNLHRRIAMITLLVVGSSPKRLMLGFMISSAFLSMWISNTATALIMTPMAVALLGRLEHDCATPEDRQHHEKYSTGLVLAVMSATSIGGTGTLTGSGPQLVMQGQLRNLFPEAPEVTYLQWSMFAVPVMIIFVLVMWVYLSMLYIPRTFSLRMDTTIIQNQYSALGPMNRGERAILYSLVILIVLWFSRDPGFSPGWASIFGWSKFLSDSTPALFVVLLLFMWPVDIDAGKTVLDASAIAALPWGIFLLIGCGFAISSGFVDSGLSDLVANALKQMDSLSDFGILFLMDLAMVFLTEFISNTAASSIVLPIIADVSRAVEINPIFLMVPVTVCASYAFLFPIATPINAVAYDTGKVSFREMAITGIFPNIFGVVLVTLMMYTLGVAVYDIDLNVFPEWAR
eukprot:TRINITY_DN2960_c0_g1_i7.p1 TRINITY_DN2960_c0_g1~~TRINITY_DN2960_c0_g1_i7.p1  ORF type:complete len:527 (-),score=141.54 TRINITY_DN2960_c0_g1_i7:11-1591(-)